MKTRKTKNKNGARSAVDMSKMTLNQKKNFASSLKIFTPVMINWNDCFARIGWRELKDLADQALHVVSIGFFIGMDKEFFYSCHGRFSTTDTVEDIHGIPWGMITSIKLLG
jgi:hypothetical protein